MFLTDIASDSLCKYRLCEGIEHLADAFSIFVFIVVFCIFSVFIISCLVILCIQTISKKKKVVFKKDKSAGGMKKCEVCLSDYSLKSFDQHRVFCSRQNQSWLAKLAKTVDHFWRQLITSCHSGQASRWSGSVIA